MNITRSESPVITSGITNGATNIPPNKVRPLNLPNLTIDKAANIPSIVAKVAFTNAIFKLILTAAQTSSDSNKTLYHLVDQPPQTRTNLE